MRLENIGRARNLRDNILRQILDTQLCRKWWQLISIENNIVNCSTYLTHQLEKKYEFLRRTLLLDIQNFKSEKYSTFWKLEPYFKAALSEAILLSEEMLHDIHLALSKIELPLAQKNIHI